MKTLEIQVVIANYEMVLYDTFWCSECRVLYFKVELNSRQVPHTLLDHETEGGSIFMVILIMPGQACTHTLIVAIVYQGCLVIAGQFNFSALE